MTLRTDYIILRKIPFQESSLVVSGLSPDYGRLDFLLKGARGSGAKKFPYAGLFRELSVEFRENPTGTGLLYLKLHEPKGNFDRIAEQPENYLKICTWVRFLLKHTRPMMEFRQTYEALRLVLSRLCTPAGGDFELAAAELVFLHESGFVPESPGDPKRAAALDGLLAYALGPETEAPGFTPEYRTRLIEWIHELSRYADSF
ncbi:MAG: recombination protein O N-terminal domain-containing protein [Lentisphaeria bacterium]|nr:recombination protein O N-terminal domain-containing protein [Lentisphaeria bacterium]